MENPLREVIERELIPWLIINAVTNSNAGPGFSRPRMVWLEHLEQLQMEARGSFQGHYRMTFDEFMLLHSYLEPTLRFSDAMARVSCGQDAISAVLILHCTIRWLAGGEMQDIRLVAGLSKASFYRCIHSGMRAILECPQLDFDFPQTPQEIETAAAGFRSIAENDVIRGCVAAVDGWLCEIRAPRAWEAPNVTSYFSGHYSCYGVSVIVAVDYMCCFVYMGITQPGSSNDVRSYESSTLYRLVESLPSCRFVLGDNGFVCTNKMVTPFCRPQSDHPVNDSFNFHLSQQRIRVEMALGYLTTKWPRLRSGLRINLCHVGLVILSAGRLHNLVISRRNTPITARDITPLAHRSQEYRRGFLPTVGAAAPTGGSTIRQVMVEEIQRRGLLRPARNLSRNRQQLSNEYA
eukprot:GHVU01232640.1.p1 GENE.GHVU01232640.1~~GHVU01232640.1.p1  ORF type:complete len:406 (+),score=20.69 GHVU01232640.1:248-1465(+)